MGAYRSKAPIVVQKKKAKPLLRNGEKAGLVLGAVLLVFSFIEGDVPLAFFLLSFFLYESRGVAEKIAEKRAAVTGEAAKLGLVGFIYLELIDASFSLDGVLGAFAISKDIILITIGLAIGAMFVRSLTLYMVELKTLKQYLYLEHGAHWAIGFLALIMFVSTTYEVPEVVTGMAGLIIVGWAFIDFLKYNKKQQLLENSEKVEIEKQENC